MATMNVPKHVSFFPYKCICAKCNLIQGMDFIFVKVAQCELVRTCWIRFLKFYHYRANCKTESCLFVFAQFGMLIIISKNAAEGWYFSDENVVIILKSDITLRILLPFKIHVTYLCRENVYFPSIHDKNYREVVTKSDDMQINFVCLFSIL